MDSASLAMNDRAQPRPVLAIAHMSWSKVLRVWLRYSWLILLVALLGAAVAYALSLAMEPVYETEAVLLLDRPYAGRLDNAADPTQLDAQQRAALVHSQIEILRGTDIVAGVINQLRLADEPMFNPTPGLRDRVLAIVGGFFPGVARLHEADGAISETLRQRQLISSYLKNLTIREDPDTYILHVGFRAPQAELAARVANAHVAAYIRWSRAQRSVAIDGTAMWLRTAVKDAHARVLAAESAVRDFNKHGVLINVDGRTALDQSLTQLTSDVATAQASLVKSEARSAEIRRLQGIGQIAGIVSISGSKLLDELQASYAQSLAEAIGSESAYGPDHPASRRARVHNGEIKAAIDREIAHFVQGETAQANIARASVTDLTAALDRTKQMVVAAQHDRMTLTRLEAEAGSERATYLSLLQKLRSYDGVDLLAAADVTLLSPAPAPDLPRSPRPALFSAFGFLVLGAMAACASVWLPNRRNVVRDTSDAASITGARCICVMPKLKLLGARGNVDRTQAGYSFFREELRALCATLVRGYAGQKQKSVSVLVTSCLPGEGKSTFCLEFGRFAAESGVRTLIVRADLCAAGHHTASGTETVILLESRLPLYGLEWEAPATVLGGDDLLRSLNAWQREFGLIIFDTPPVSAMAESVILAPLADATIVLARVDQTPRSLLTSVTEQIGKAGGRLAGLVITFAGLDTQRGIMPSDVGYYFNRNRNYHRRLSSHRAIG